MKIKINESTLRSIISETVKNVLKEKFNFGYKRTSSANVNLEEVFPFLDNYENNANWDGVINITYNYEPADKGDYFTPPSGPDYDFISCEPANKKNWEQFVAEL